MTPTQPTYLLGPEAGVGQSRDHSRIPLRHSRPHCLDGHRSKRANLVGAREGGFACQADGVVGLTNQKDEPKTILEDNIRLIGGNRKNYSVSDDALLALDDQLAILDEIQPDVTEKGSLVYDVPQRAVSGSQLQVEDLYSEQRGRIDLGL
jgi:hypothetical protein